MKLAKQRDDGLECCGSLRASWAPCSLLPAPSPSLLATASSFRLISPERRSGMWRLQPDKEPPSECSNSNYRKILISITLGFIDCLFVGVSLLYMVYRMFLGPCEDARWHFNSQCSFWPQADFTETTNDSLAVEQLCSECTERESLKRSKGEKAENNLFRFKASS